MSTEPFPKYLSFEKMTDTFFLLLKDRYPSADKVIQVISGLDVDNIHDKIIILSTMRDAIKEVSPRLYRSLQHRDDLYMAIIEALENLEDELDEMEEYEEGEDEDESAVEELEESTSEGLEEDENDDEEDNNRSRS